MLSINDVTALEEIIKICVTSIMEHRLHLWKGLIISADVCVKLKCIYKLNYGFKNQYCTSVSHFKISDHKI